MKRTMIALAAGGLILTGCSAPPAEVPKLSGDAKFAESVRALSSNDDISDDQLVEAAGLACDAADVVPGPAFAARLIQESPKFSFDGREFAFAEASINEYCPEKLSAPATTTAPARTDGSAFRATLITAGLPAVQRLSDDYIDLAGKLCRSLDRGVTVEQLVEASTETYSEKQSTALVSASVAHYCGQHTTEVIEYVVAHTN